VGSAPKVTVRNGRDDGTNDPATTAPEARCARALAGVLVEVAMTHPPVNRLPAQERRVPRAALRPRPTVADQLERFTPRFDELIHRARLATSTADFDELEETATAISRELRAVFRSPTPRAAPLFVTADGKGAMF